MYLRLFVAFAVVAGLTAFSPAPFPKTERKREVDDLVQLQGTYKVIDYGRPVAMNAARLAIRRSEMKVQISNTKWAFQYSNGNNGWVNSTTYDIKLQAKTSPKQIDMTYSANDYTVTMKGIYKIEGKKITIVYVNTYSGARFGGMAVVERPTSFDGENNNAMLITMERE